MALTDLAPNFGLHLGRSLPRKEKGIFSPMSAYFALGMLLKASSGDTRDEVAALLGFAHSDVAEAEVQRAFWELKECDDVSISNGLFFRSGIDLVPEGVHSLVHSFRAHVQDWGLDPAEGANLINGWVHEKTQGQIPRIVDSIHPMDQTILVNALTFDGKWSKPFHAVREPRPFRSLAGDQQVPMMEFTDEPLGYAEHPDYTVFELSYWHTFTFRMLVPRNGSAQDWMCEATDEGVNAPVKKTQANFTMPRFELRDSMDLTQFIPETLQRRANLTRLLVPNLPMCVPKMRQESWIEVDLFGTRAAAASGCYLRAACAAPKPIDLCVDRPFVFMVRHAPSNRTLFMGWIDDFR
jgi:serine protease inhibitor